MKRTQQSLEEIISATPDYIRREVALSNSISSRIEQLMKARGLNKKQFATAIGKQPCEITKWLSGQHNFTMATLAMISSFFDEDIVVVKG